MRAVRFAPTPSGFFHAGSLFAAVMAWAYAQKIGARFLVRIEDLDQGRTRPEFVDDIYACLAAMQLPVDAWQRQSESQARYRHALGRLERSGQLYRCRCTRKDLADANRNEDGEAIYPGTCSNLNLSAGAWRLRVPADPISIEDLVWGTVSQNLAHTLGDFVVMRANGEASYHLASVVDDASSGVTDIVRGADLLSSSPRQAWLRRCLGLAEPETQWHHPVLVKGGAKVSKSKQDPPIRDILTRESPEQMLGWIAFWLGWQTARRPLGHQDFLDLFRVDSAQTGIHLDEDDPAFRL